MNKRIQELGLKVTNVFRHQEVDKAQGGAGAREMGVWVRESLGRKQRKASSKGVGKTSQEAEVRKAWTGEEQVPGMMEAFQMFWHSFFPMLVSSRVLYVLLEDPLSHLDIHGTACIQMPWGDRKVWR